MSSFERIFKVALLQLFLKKTLLFYEMGQKLGCNSSACAYSIFLDQKFHEIRLFIRQTHMNIKRPTFEMMTFLTFLNFFPRLYD